MKNIPLRIFSILCWLSLFPNSAFSQANTYNAYIRQITFTDCTHLEFEVWIEWTGTNTQKFEVLQAGINFNYAGLANGGTMTGAFQPGSADPSLPPSQQNPNWNINPVSKQIRLIAALASPSSTAIILPPPPGLRLGKFIITNTVNFSAGATPNFSWQYASGSGFTTQTSVAFYLNSATVGTIVTDPATHFVVNNPAFNMSCILPIELVRFNAVPVGDEIKCTWETSTEINNDYFEVQSGQTGIEFNTLGKVNGYGPGTCSNARNYLFIDSNKCKDIRYYRLKQTDIDGAYSFTNTIVLDCREHSGIYIWPNPVSGSLIFQFNCPVKGPLKVEIIDNAGGLVYEEIIDADIGTNTFTRSIEKFASGLYTIRIISPGDRMINLRNLFMKY
jgi:hypothetical protein